MKYFYSFDESSIPMSVQVLFWVLYMAVFVYALWKTLSAPKSKRRSDVGKLFILFFVGYTVFYCINPDYFRYREWIYDRDFDYWVKEVFYIFVVMFCRNLPFDYPFEIFRLIVWGGGVLIAYFTFRKYRKLLQPGLALLFLFVFCAGTFSYSRASLGMAVYFFGIAWYLQRKGFISKGLGLAVALSSVWFHHEMIIGVAALPAVLIPFERRKDSFLAPFLLIAATVVISYVNSHLGVFDELFDNDILSSKVEEFNNAEQGRFRLSTLVKYLNYFYPFYLITKCFRRRKVPRSIAGIYRITYTIILVSVAFMIVFGLRSVFAYRVLYISMIPLALLITFCYCNGYFKNKHLFLMLLLALLYNSTRFINAV